MRELEARAIAALRAFGVLMTDTCINYQTIMPPVRGEHLAMGDTGVVIYSNSVFGARSNFEGGPSALAAGLTGRTPRYGYHLDEHRRADPAFPARGARRATCREWGALGGIVGRACGSYWEVPLIEGVAEPPGSDALKHFGAALASYGSVALFHMPGITAETHIGPPASCRHAGRRPAIPRSAAPRSTPLSPSYGAAGDKVDVVVFAAPQLSLIEMAEVADALDGRAGPCRDDAAGRDLARDQVRRRPHGADRAHRGVRRGRRRRHLLLPELCRRDGRGQWLEAAADQLGEARQHHRRLRLPPDPGEPRALRRFGGRRKDRLMPIVLRCHPGIGPAVTGTALVAKDNFSARYDLDRKAGHVLPPERTRSPGRAMTAASWCSTRPRAASRRPGCCAR